MTMLPNLESLSIKDLLRLESGIVAELRNREVVRTNNKPLGDIAEQIVFVARGGFLEANSNKSHDITDKIGRRIQVKAIGGRLNGSAARFSPFRSLDFDTAVFLVFAPDSFELAIAREASAGEVEAVARYSPHTNGRQPTLRQVKSIGVDVTTEMRQAFEALEAQAVGSLND